MSLTTLGLSDIDGFGHGAAAPSHIDSPVRRRKHWQLARGMMMS